MIVLIPLLWVWLVVAEAFWFRDGEHLLIALLWPLHLVKLAVEEWKS